MNDSTMKKKEEEATGGEEEEKEATGGEEEVPTWPTERRHREAAADDRDLSVSRPYNPVKTKAALVGSRIRGFDLTYKRNDLLDSVTGDIIDPDNLLSDKSFLATIENMNRELREEKGQIDDVESVIYKKMNFLFKLINHKFSTHLPDTILNKLRDLLRSLGRTKEKRLKIRTKLFKKYKNIKNTNNKFNLCGTKWMGKWSEVHTCATEDTSQSAGEKNSLGGYTKKHKNPFKVGGNAAGKSV